MFLPAKICIVIFQAKGVVHCSKVIYLFFKSALWIFFLSLSLGVLPLSQETFLSVMMIDMV